MHCWVAHVWTASCGHSGADKLSLYYNWRWPHFRDTGCGRGEEYVDRNDARNDACQIQILHLRKKLLKHATHGQSPVQKKIRDWSGVAMDRPGPEPGTGLVRTLINIWTFFLFETRISPQREERLEEDRNQILYSVP